LAVQVQARSKTLQTSTSETAIELLRETAATLFVINLCASTTPVALVHPEGAELKRFNFFVTRRREEGRERFRLHMGYFDTLEQAEQMLAAVRDIYPAAWAGPAPENRAPPARASRAAVVAVPSRAAPTVAAVPVAAPRVAVPPAPVAVAPPPVSAAASVPASVTMPASAPVPAPVAPAVAAPPAAVASVGLESMSNVREVLAELADEAPPKARPPVTLKAAPPPPAKAPAKPAAAPPAPLTPAQTLEVLETLPNVDPDAGSTSTRIRVLTPEDTQTLRDIKLEAQSNAPASYAVQLVWAVQPIDMDSLPHLAIFDAYKLYHVEGNRHGRRWYGLRLGFFTDPTAAKQVAMYVRSEYTAVAVVPVTAKEKNSAAGPATATPAPQAAPATPPRPDAANIPTVKPLGTLAARPADVVGFELLADDSPRAPKRDLDDVTPAGKAAAAGAKPAPARTTPKATGKAPGKRAVVRRRPGPPGAPNPLESTLEILGASTLTLDESREIINDSAIRKPVAKKERTGRFARLLSRLSEKKD
jgi:hypothetical protein